MTAIPVYNIRLVRERTLHFQTPPLNSPATAAQVLRTYLDDPDREHFVVLLLNTRHRVIGIHTAHIGSLNQCPIVHREVFKAAVLANAAAIIVGHNHPTGDPTPSRDDQRITKDLQAAGQLMGIEVLDHIVLGADPDHYSFKEHGLL